MAYRIKSSFQKERTNLRNEILRLTALGFSRDEIGKQVHKSGRTVQHHIEALREEFGARNTNNLIALAVSWGVITIMQNELHEKDHR